MLTAFFDCDGTIAKDYPDAVWATVSSAGRETVPYDGNDTFISVGGGFPAPRLWLIMRMICL